MNESGKQKVLLAVLGGVALCAGVYYLASGSSEKKSGAVVAVAEAKPIRTMTVETGRSIRTDGSDVSRSGDEVIRERVDREMEDDEATKIKIEREMDADANKPRKPMKPKG